MLEPSSSEDENEEVQHHHQHHHQQQQHASPALIDGDEVVVGGGGYATSSNPRIVTTYSNQSNIAGGSAYSTSPSPQSHHRSISPHVECSPAHSRANAQSNNYLTDKFLPARASLAHIRATSPAPPESIAHHQELDQPPEDAEIIDEEERAAREEAERKNKLQLYVFVLRCIAYPFNAKQQTDLSRRPLKITMSQLEQINARFQSFLKGELSIQADESFVNAIANYYEAFLQSNRLHMIVASGACSAHDFREVFRQNIEKRVRSLPDKDGMHKEAVISQWLTKFDSIFRGFDEGESKKFSGSKMQQYQQQQQQHLASELILSKEQLYDMFQNILKIKKFEHQLLYNALQVRSVGHVCASPE